MFLMFAAIEFHFDSFVIYVPSVKAPVRKAAGNSGVTCMMSISVLRCMYFLCIDSHVFTPRNKHPLLYQKTIAP